MDPIIPAEKENNFWSNKPPWCQPWTILATGFFIIILTWLLFKIYIITSIITLLVLIWWFFFLYFVPTIYKASVNEISKKN